MWLHRCHILLVKGQFLHAWPLFNARGATEHEDFIKLVAIVMSLKQWCAVHNFGEDTSH